MHAREKLELFIDRLKSAESPVVNRLERAVATYQWRN